MKKRVIIITLLLVVALGVYIAYTKFKEETPDLMNRKPDVAIDAKKLIEAFEADTVAAAKAYIGKVLEVTGRVKSIDTSGALVLGTEDSPSEVVVGLDRRHMTDYRNIRVGFVTIVQGECSGYSKSGSNPDDLLSGLGTTVELKAAGVKNMQ